MLKLKQDLRISFRQWRRSPAFTAAAILALGLGIGATVAMFSVVDAVILRPLPIHEPDRVVRIWETTPEGDDFSVAASNYLDFRAGSGTLEELAAYRAAPLNLTGDGRPTRLDAVASTHTLFRLLGAEPILGRSFTAEEDAPGGDRRVIVLSHDVWQARYAGAPDIVGRTITADGESYTVIGVMAPGFRYPGTDAWVPLAPDPHHNRSDHWLDVVGRLRPGATVGAAEAELAAISRRIAIDHPEVAGWGVRASTLSEAIVGADFRLAALVLFAAVGLLLLIACANVANLLLARAATRRVEMAVRTAIGASRTRLLQQLLTESAVLGLAGAAVGLILAYLAVDLLRIADPSLLPRLEEVRIGGRVVLFAVSLGMLTSLLFGTAPALAATRRPAGEVVRQSERAGARGGRVRDSLVVVQVALAVTLLVGAGLMIQSFQRLQGVDPGFTAENVYTVPLQLPASDYREPWQKVVFVSSVVDRLESDPRVISAGATAIDPFSEWNLVNDVTPEERAAEVGSGGYLQAGWRVVTPGFFSTMEVPLIQGRVFTDADRWDGPRQVVITRSLAERLWPGADPVGRRIFWGGTDGEPLTVIGVVGDVQDVRPGETPTPLIFLPHNQLPWPMMTLVVKTAGEPAGIQEAIRQAIWELDASMPVPAVELLSRNQSRAVAGRAINTLVMTGFAAIALVLASLGLYGLMTFNVMQRTREFGIRLALGAERATVMRTILLRALALTVIGLAGGTIAALMLTRMMTGLLFETAPADLPTYLGVAVTITVVTLFAAFLPARRATRVDPATAMRS
jgi:putative ABC transport system permease protein